MTDSLPADGLPGADGFDLREVSHDVVQLNVAYTKWSHHGTTIGRSLS
jgi:hypothetical protein